LTGYEDGIEAKFKIAAGGFGVLLCVASAEKSGSKEMLIVVQHRCGLQTWYERQQPVNSRWGVVQLTKNSREVP
jgi:hypothetical protein